MPFPTENEWDIVDPATRTNTMESTDSIAQGTATTPTPTPAPAAAPPTIELTINAKPKAEEKKDNDTECTCGASGKPKLVRQDSFESVNSMDDDYRRPHRRVRPNYPRRYSFSPVRVRPIQGKDTTGLLASSSQLLDKAGKYDGLVDLPFPARGSVYLSTFPFTDKDVKKWAWLFSLGVEDTFLAESGRGRGLGGDSDDDDADNAYPTVRPVRRNRDRSPYYDPGTIDIPSVFLSRALDKDVVPEDESNARYLIVTQNRHRPAGSKLLVAESRKAAGMLMYYEMLKGDSIMFVGATVYHGKKTVHPKRFRKVETLDEANKMTDEGWVGIIC